MKYLSAGIAIIIAYLWSYLLWSFVNIEFDVTKWNEPNRFFLVLVGTLFAAWGAGYCLLFEIGKGVRK